MRIAYTDGWCTERLISDLLLKQGEQTFRCADQGYSSSSSSSLCYRLASSAIDGRQLVSITSQLVITLRLLSTLTCVAMRYRRPYVGLWCEYISSSPKPNIRASFAVSTKTSSGRCVHVVKLSIINWSTIIIEDLSAITAQQHKTRDQSNLTKSASRGAHSPVRGHRRGSKVVPLNSWGRVSY